MSTVPRTQGAIPNVNVAELPGIHLDPLEFDLLLTEFGNSGEYRRAALCPCVRPDTGTPALECPDCHGHRYVYPMHLREPMIFLDTQRNATFKQAAAGTLAEGTVHLTFPTRVLPATGDMILPDGEEHVVSERFVRDGTRRVTDAMLRPLRTYTVDQVPVAPVERVERLLYGKPCCVEVAAWKDADGNNVYGSELDYHIDEDGRWLWHRTRGPAVGTTWTVRYRAPACYVINLAGAQYRSEADQGMPRPVSAQRLDKLAHQDLRP